MFDLESTTKDCQKTLDELERVRVEGDGLVSGENVLEQLSTDSQAHTGRCLDCRAAVEQFAEARNLLRPLKTIVEIDDRQNDHVVLAWQRRARVTAAMLEFAFGLQADRHEHDVRRRLSWAANREPRIDHLQFARSQ